MRAPQAVGVGDAVVRLEPAHDAGPEGNVQGRVRLGCAGIVLVCRVGIAWHRPVAVGKHVRNRQDAVTQTALAFARGIDEASKGVRPVGINRELLFQRIDGRRVARCSGNRTVGRLFALQIPQRFVIQLADRIKRLVFADVVGVQRAKLVDVVDGTALCMALVPVSGVAALRIGVEDTAGGVPLSAWVGAADQVEVVIEGFGAKVLQWRAHDAAITRAAVVLQITEHGDAKIFGVYLKLPDRFVIAARVPVAQAAPFARIRVVRHQAVFRAVGVTHQVSDLIKVTFAV